MEMAKVDFIQDFLEDCKLRGMSNESVRSYKSSLLIYNKHLEKKEVEIEKIDRNIIRGFIKYLKEREISLQ